MNQDSARTLHLRLQRPRLLSTPTRQLGVRPRGQGCCSGKGPRVKQLLCLPACSCLPHPQPPLTHPLFALAAGYTATSFSAKVSCEIGVSDGLGGVSCPLQLKLMSVSDATALPYKLLKTGPVQLVPEGRYVWHIVTWTLATPWALKPDTKCEQWGVWGGSCP